MKKLLAIALLLIAVSPVHAAMFGPLFSGSSQTAPPAGHAPVVTSFACTVALPVVNGTNVNLVGGGTCNYTATCNSIPCNGGDAITSWAITAQSTANSFSIVSANGILRGGSAAASVTAGSYTVTVTAANSTGTSPGVVQTVTVVTPPPVVSSLGCTIKTPITNNTNVTLQAGGNCQYSATNTPTSWTVTADTCTSCYQVTNAGILQGSTNAATVVNRADTVTVTASNAGGASAPVGQTVTAISAPVITNQNMSVTLPITNGMTIGTMVASPTPASWAITAVSGDSATTSDFAISSGGAITTAQASPPGVITGSGTITISMTATNATGTSATGTATVTVNAAGGDPYSSVDGSPGAPGDTGNALYTFFQNPASIATPVANPLAKYHAVGHADARTFNAAGPPNYAPGDPNYYQPGWQVAGIDYPVGIRPSFVPLKTDILTNPPACASISGTSGNHQLNINSSNCTIQGYDLSVDGGVNFWVPSSSTTNVLYSDNYYKAGTQTQDAIDCNNAGVTVQYSVIDGNSKTTNTAAQINRCWKFNYVWTLQPQQDMFNYGESQPGTTSATQGLFVNFSVLQDTGCGGGHADIYQAGGPPGGGNPWNPHFTFDFIWQRGAGNSLCASTEGTQGIFFSGSSGQPPFTGTILNTVYITAKDSGGGTELNGFAQYANGSSTDFGAIVSPGIQWRFNYADPTGTSGNWNKGPGSVVPTPSTLLSINNNLNMTSGLSDGAAGWNHQP